jgi:hypothetical protein
MKRSALSSFVALSLAAASLFALPAAPPVLRVADKPERSVVPESLLGRDQRDVRVETADGDVTVYHGLPLLEVLEKNGLELKTMGGERESAATVLLASGRDGYTVVFSVGELKSARANPVVFLVAETSMGPLPENEGPVRLIVLGDKVRSAYGLATIELEALAQNKRK